MLLECHDVKHGPERSIPGLKDAIGEFSCFGFESCSSGFTLFRE